MTKKINQNSLKNLEKRNVWQPGETGNPNGRPKAKEPMQRINVYLPTRLIGTIDQQGNRSAFIREAIEQKLKVKQ